MSVMIQQCVVGILTRTSEERWRNVNDPTSLKRTCCFPAQPPSLSSPNLIFNTGSRILAFGWINPYPPHRMFFHLLNINYKEHHSCSEEIWK